MKTELLKVNEESVALGARLIREGELVGFPTETVYGLGANALDARAVAKIFEAKGRPQDNPLITHVACVEEIPPLVRAIPAAARKLMEAFWPGPMTLILPKAEQIPNDFYRKGDTIKAIVKSVEMNNNQPRIILSRTANQFLERLFEQEVPEIFDGLITLKKIVRIPGERAKVAVESYDERIDPVGACVGMKGSRIYSIVKELRNENIDVVNYTTNPQLMIQRALNPAKISSITIDEEKKTASVYLKPDQVSLAIGKGGLNIRLSKMLTGYDIDVYREIEEEDVALTEFADEIDGWVIDALKACGCDTAKSVLELPVEEIAARADLELEQAQKVVEILKAEFEE